MAAPSDGQTGRRVDHAAARPHRVPALPRASEPRNPYRVDGRTARTRQFRRMARIPVVIVAADSAATSLAAVGGDGRMTRVWTVVLMAVVAAYTYDFRAGDRAA